MVRLPGNPYARATGNGRRRHLTNRLFGTPGGLGAFGALEVVPGVSTGNDDATKDFVGGVDLGGKYGRWPGADATWVALVASSLTDALNDPSLTDWANEAQSLMSDAAGKVGQAQRWSVRVGVPVWQQGRTAEQDDQYFEAMKALLYQLQQFKSGYDQMVAELAKEKTDAQAAAQKTATAPRKTLTIQPQSTVAPTLTRMAWKAGVRTTAPAPPAAPTDAGQAATPTGFKKAGFFDSLDFSLLTKFPWYVSVPMVGGILYLAYRSVRAIEKRHA